MSHSPNSSTQKKVIKDKSSQNPIKDKNIVRHSTEIGHDLDSPVDQHVLIMSKKVDSHLLVTA